MYDSYVLTLFYKAYYKLHSWYLNSIVRKLELSFRRGLRRLSYGSSFLNFLSNDKSLIQKSFIYRFYRRFLDLINHLTEKSRSISKNLSRESFIVNSISELFVNKKNTIKTISVFFLFFSAPLFLRGEGIIFLVLTVISIILLLLSSGVSDAFKSSKTINFLISIFEIDKEEC